MKEPDALDGTSSARCRAATDGATSNGIVLAQVRTYQPAKDFVARKKAEGKSWREALRALKRHLARIVFRILSQPGPQGSSLGA